MDMARNRDVFDRAVATLVLDANRLKTLADEMRALSSGYNRYLALQREAESHEASSKRLVGLLGDKGLEVAQDENGIIRSEVEAYPDAMKVRDGLPLWELVAQYLRFVPEAQVGDILSFFDWMAIEVSRQAVEAAINSHLTVFAVRKKDREKFISLKGAQFATSTKR